MAEQLRKPLSFETFIHLFKLAGDIWAFLQLPLNAVTDKNTEEARVGSRSFTLRDSRHHFPCVQTKRRATSALFEFLCTIVTHFFTPSSTFRDRSFSFPLQACLFRKAFYTTRSHKPVLNLTVRWEILFIALVLSRSACVVIKWRVPPRAAITPLLHLFIYSHQTFSYPPGNAELPKSDIFITFCQVGLRASISFFFFFFFVLDLSA